ncbi:DNA polymerase kappa like protein [Argiope bruennichi]|uniref:DNA polymerase kappa n=1 Tax=Argiope bruennichi TaxID=94029 RepID=A0A8T0EAF1_ARGBR|nr:DNA polymerase kappa like protein [Argiope bruennichi]
MEAVTSPTELKTMQLNDQKAGMQGLDKEHINKIIYEASKGTPYFAFQEKRQKSIDRRVKEFKSVLQRITDAERSASLKKMNILCASLEAERDLSHSIVHIDMDAFYAAVEMEDNPKLKGKPIAVGSSSMLSTSNYEARKYGVRAAMPGFIGKKLCPQLVIVPCHFKRYREISNKVRHVIEEYDPNYSPASLDEMYLDLTEYIKHQYKKQTHQNICLKQEPTVTDASYETCQKCSMNVPREDRDHLAYNIVKEIREQIYAVTNLTASAGIAPNVMLAKVCSDQKKPNGQYQILSTLEAVNSFVSSMPVKKVSGIGPVTGQILNALGIHTCWDMWEKRDVIPILFKESSADFYMRVALGIGSTVVKSDYVRKSIGTEQTFREISHPEDLHTKCQELCQEVVEELKLRNMVGKVVVLKYKTTSFDSHTRNHSLPYHTADEEVIYNTARKLLDSEIAAVAPKPLCLRLMGIRIVNLIYEDMIQSDEKQIKIKDFLKPKLTENQTLCEEQTTSTDSYQKDPEECKGNTCKENETSISIVSSKPATSEVLYICPVCNASQIKTLDELNTHIDNCLNKAAIKEILSRSVWRGKKKATMAGKTKCKEESFP